MKIILDPDVVKFLFSNLTFSFQQLHSDRVNGAADAVQGGVQRVLHEVPRAAQSPRVDHSEGRRARRPAEEDDTGQQPV